MKPPKSNRAPISTRTLRLVDEQVRERILAAVKHAPIDSLRPLEVSISEPQKKRSRDANSLMWSGPLADMAEQAYLEGRTYRAEVWHEWAKREFLPEEYDPALCLKGYEKYAVDPSGHRVLIGSTTMLTVYGMSGYLEQLYAAGAALGVQFNVRGEG